MKDQYRGEDQLLNKIKARADALADDEDCLGDSVGRWNAACKEISKKFAKEGLEASAKEALGHSVEISKKALEDIEKEELAKKRFDIQDRLSSEISIYGEC